MLDISFTQLIQKVDAVSSTCVRDEVKLRRSGELIYLGSEQILQKADTLLEKSQQLEIDETDTQIDNSFNNFLASLTQQSISTLFLTKYLQPRPITDYHREITKSIKFLSATEALDELAEDLLESEIFTLAHDEDINSWINLVFECLEANAEVSTLAQIAKITNLSIAQVFVSLLFGDFELLQSGDFYEGLAIEVKSVR